MKKITLVLIVSLIFSFLPTVYTAHAASIRKPEVVVKVITYKKSYNDIVYPYSSGSGTLISEDGVILTNNHVVQENENTDETFESFSICVVEDQTDKPECKYTASLIERNDSLDLALLKIDLKDIYGNPVEPDFNYAKYDHERIPEVGDEVVVAGYPGIGFDSMTVTQGIVSGFEDFDGATYIKTDTNFSPGSSGGAAFDDSGRLIGVPTMAFINVDVLGYMLDISEAISWIDDNINYAPTKFESTRKKVAAKAMAVEEVNNTGIFEHTDYPNFQFNTHHDWQLTGISGYRYQFKNSKDVALSISVDPLPFPATEDTVDYVMSQMQVSAYGDVEFEKSITNFETRKAYLVTAQYGSLAIRAMMVPYGYSLVTILIVQDSDTTTDDYFSNIESDFDFLETEEMNPTILETLEYSDPPFAINKVDSWYMMRNYQTTEENLLLTYLRPDNYTSTISLYYYPLFISKQDKTPQELKEDDIDYYKYSNKNLAGSGDAVIDGLPGYTITLTYEKDNQEYKSTAVSLLDNDHYFYIEYEALIDDFDEGYEAFQQILNTFDYQGMNASQPGTYTIDSSSTQFPDIANHRYEENISDLHAKGLIGGYDDGLFKPERSISRAEALKILLEAKKYYDLNQDNNTETEYQDYERYESDEFAYLDFADTKNLGWEKKYIRFAHDKGIVNGYQGKFYYLQTVTIAEILKMSYEVFDVSIWDYTLSPGTNWTVPVMDKGFENGYIPAGITDPNYQTKRGEYCYIISNMLSEAAYGGYLW